MNKSYFNVKNIRSLIFLWRFGKNDWVKDFVLYILVLCNCIKREKYNYFYIVLKREVDVLL